MIVLGLDPSLTAYGWAVVERAGSCSRVLASGCVRTEKDAKKSHMYAADQDAQRIILLAHGIEEALRLAFGRATVDSPLRVVCEAPAGAQHATSAKALGQSLGVTLGVLTAGRIACRFVQAHEVKQRIGGAKDASKDAVAVGVTRLTTDSWRSTASTKPAREGEADAVAVALTLTLEELRA